MPLADTRLNENDGRAPAYIAGFVQDEQAKLNLRNLASSQGIERKEIEAFERLLGVLGLNTALAEPIARRMQEALAAAAQREPALALASVEEALRRGGDAQVPERLREFVTVLPERTLVNANTAAAKVLAAQVPARRVGRTPHRGRAGLGVLPRPRRGARALAQAGVPANEPFPRGGDALLQRRRHGDLRRRGQGRARSGSEVGRRSPADAYAQGARLRKRWHVRSHRLAELRRRQHARLRGSGREPYGARARQLDAAALPRLPRTELVPPASDVLLVEVAVPPRFPARACRRGPALARGAAPPSAPEPAFVVAGKSSVLAVLDRVLFDLALLARLKIKPSSATPEQLSLPCARVAGARGGGAAVACDRRALRHP